MSPQLLHFKNIWLHVQYSVTVQALIVVFSDGANGRVCERVHNGGQTKGNTVCIHCSTSRFHLRENYSFLTMKPT